MKWKLYQLASLYNLVFSAGFACMITFSIIKRSGLEDLAWLFLFLVMMAVVAIKNQMSYRLYLRMKSKEAHTERFGVAFYFLWVLNLVVLVLIGILLYIITGRYVEMGFRYYDLLSLLLHVSVYLAFLTMGFVLCLDIPIEKRVTRQEELPADFLQAGDR